MPKDVQYAVHHQSQHLFANGHALPLRVVTSDLRTNVDVSDHRTTFSGSLQPKRDDVSRPAMTKVAPIELGNRRAADEGDRQHRILHAFGPERGECRLLHPRARSQETPHAGGYVYRNPARLRPHSLTAARIRSGARIRGVRLDDLAHQAMANDIRIGEVVKPDAIDAGQDSLYLHEARILPRRKINLGFIPGNHSL